MKPIIIVFFIMNLIITLPLYLFSPQNTQLQKTAIVSIVLFSIVWLLIYQLIKIGKIQKIDSISLALGAVVAVKFFGSLVVFLFMFYSGLLTTKLAIGIFLLVYTLYAVFSAVFGSKQVKD